jgi:hypothetical protein
MHKFLFVLFLSFVTQIAFACGGGSTTGEDGGHGVLCHVRTPLYEDPYAFRDYSLETLDLFEARSKFKAMRLKKDKQLVFDLPQREVSIQVCKVLDSRFHNLMKFSKNISVMGTVFHEACEMRFSWADIELTHDHGLVQTKIPRYCKLVQLGVTKRKDSERKVILDRDLTEWLEVEQLAALALHESLHGYFDETRSTLAVRQMVMFAFANQKFLRANVNLLEQLIDQRKPIDPLTFSIR